MSSAVTSVGPSTAEMAERSLVGSPDARRHSSGRAPMPLKGQPGTRSDEAASPAYRLALQLA